MQGTKIGGRVQVNEQHIYIAMSFKLDIAMSFLCHFPYKEFDIQNMMVTKIIGWPRSHLGPKRQHP